LRGSEKWTQVEAHCIIGEIWGRVRRDACYVFRHELSF